METMVVDDILDPKSRDIKAMLELNNAHAGETSFLDLESLNALLESAFILLGVDGGVTGFLIALDHNASYANPNFQWFKVHRKSFVYIARIVVKQSARGQGVARRLYNDLFAAAKLAGFSLVVCEVNIDPPNPVSESFHAAMGFIRVGESTTHSGTKTVGYLEKFLL